MNDKLLKALKGKMTANKPINHSEEWLRCRVNPIYFILNYIYIPETGGRLKYSKEILHPKVRRLIATVYKYRLACFMASRQLGKSTIAGCLIAWAIVFFPGIQAVILNMKMSAGLHNLSIIRFILENLPEWMITNKPFASDSKIKTYIELFNGSKVQVFYPSTVHSPGTLARSLTAPILYIDESAFIPNMGAIYGSAQPILSRARAQADKNGYPWFTLVTSTPNGVAGAGEWFHDRWDKAVDSDLLFSKDEGSDIETWRTDIDLNPIILNEDKNRFIRVKYHWSEDPTKDEAWYKQQCQELSDQRQINQELDLIFVGGTNCIFTDDQLASFKVSPPIYNRYVRSNASLNIFEENLDPLDYYIIGADTAKSLNGAECAIQIFSFKHFNQIAELHDRFGSYTRFGEVIADTFQWLFAQVGTRIILAIENNTIGAAPIEYLVEHVHDFNYVPYLFVDEKTSLDPRKDTKFEYGITTTGQSKPLMFGHLLQNVNETPQGFRSPDLVRQFGTMIKTNAGTITSTGTSDLVMATCFCAYARSKKLVEILPLVSQTNDEINTNLFNMVKDVANASNFKTFNKEREQHRQRQYVNDMPIVIDDNFDMLPSYNEQQSDDTFFMPFYSE